MNPPVAARRALLAAVLSLPAWSARGQPVAVTGVPTAPENWWFYLANDMADDLQILLVAGADPNVRDGNGQPSLLRAVERNAWRVFDVLAASERIDLNIENPIGETPLMYLAVVGDTARAHALIRRGARVNRLGWTPLHYAASRAQLATARLLLGAGALPNAPAPLGRTPLMMAAYSGSAEMVQLLLAHGAEPTTRDANGQDAADWASRQNWQALATELRRVINERLARRAEERRNAPPYTGEIEVFPVQ